VTGWGTHGFPTDPLLPDTVTARSGPLARVAALADVHGNAPALEAVLAEVEAAAPDLIVFCGDLTWGPLPEETLALVEPLGERARFVRGNSERELAERMLTSARATWLHERLAAAGDHLGACRDAVVVEIDGLGSTRFCHGSPRSDEELVTVGTPEDRVREFLEGVEERVVVTAHTHVRYDRRVGATRLLNPGSVGMPYEGEAGAAFWAVLGPDVELRRTEYELEPALVRMRAGGMPDFEQIEEVLRNPPTPAEVIEHAEGLVFSG
jgi:putative phosphoesterase